ncbi:MAG: RNA-directed DNA polymerase, partial [Elusimicrobiaceae bacterium]|nr:RNA-directed DNA polymerase [Elusimicrobiaceae bacterium]
MSKNILSLSAGAAKEFFLQQNNYCNIPLPSYFKFDNLLRAVNKKLQGKTHADFQSRTKLDEMGEVNSIIYHSTDGKYQWRPLQILHPVLYVELVNCVCESKNWDFIRKRFKQFSANPHIKCASIPLVNQPKKTMTAASVLNWWREIEQSLLSQALEYSYIVTTDITDFYSSIYTHTIPWALHTKSEAQKKKRNKQLFGNKIDTLIQDMQHKQTNGIPQGSVLMDFFAEMVLGYADEILTKSLSEEPISKYLIFRYRDD